MPEETRVQIIQPASADEFRRYYTLRWRILRAPWNQPRGSERDPLDDSSTHLMAVGSNGAILAVGRLHFNNIREAQIRYMAVDLPYQRMGYGSLLLAALEQRAITLGAARITLDARESALGFYRKHGYLATGIGHVLFNQISHMTMTKPLGCLQEK